METLTERAMHAAELAAEQTDDVDGIVVAGGDGLLNEVMTGMLNRDDGKRFPLGLLASGSTNTVAWSTVGTDCVVTAALQIILGCTSPMDVGTVAQQGEPLRCVSPWLPPPATHTPFRRPARCSSER